MHGYYWVVGGRFTKPFVARLGTGNSSTGPYVWASVPGMGRPTDFDAERLAKEGSRFYGPIANPTPVVG